MSPSQKQRLKKGAARDGLDVAPWLLRLAVRDTQGRGAEMWDAIHTVRPAQGWEDGEKRELTMNVLMTPAQKEAVEKRAAYLGQAVSSWLLLLGLLEAGR